MTKIRKVALIGMSAAIGLTVIAVIFGFPPAVAGVHAMPFAMLFIIDLSRKGTDQKPRSE